MRRELTRVVTAARAEQRTHLLESEALAIAAGLGLGVPRHVVVPDAAAATRLPERTLPGDRVVVKVLSAAIQHKTDVGGVAVVANEPAAIAAAIGVMSARLAGHDVAGFLVAEFVAHDRAFGGELLVGARWTEDFGAVVTLGAGGTDVEVVAQGLRPGNALAFLSPSLGDGRHSAVDACTAIALATTPRRGRPPRVERARLDAVVASLLRLAADVMPDELVELEFNPVVATDDGALVALDALARVGDGPRDPAPARPLDKLARLLEPRSIAVLGVSDKPNPGRLILENVLREGYPTERVFVVKPGRDEFRGCRCVPDVAALPEPVDLLVVAVDASQVPDVVQDVILRQKAESIVLIPGGLGETEGSADRVRAMRDALAASRATPWRGPLVNGGNCLGVRSRPGRFDTLFIPEHKLRFPGGPPAPLAFLSQSGAFAVARASDLGRIEPRYVVTVGNQLDLTIGDYLERLGDDPELAVFACYVEGFQPGDGLRFVRAAQRITADRAKAVVLYRGGRSAAGARAAASHTASVAGDFELTRALATQAGVLVADTLEEFDDLVRLALLLRDRSVDGPGLGAVTNAGFESVAIADNLGPLGLAELGADTRSALLGVLAALRLDAVVGVHNPLDLTPIAGDRGYDEAVRIVLDDPAVDVGLVGCVPLTGALQTLAPGGHAEDLARPDAVGPRLAERFRATRKAWIAVVDGGPDYDALAGHLASAGIPTFRRADRALRAFARYCAWRLAR